MVLYNKAFYTRYLGATTLCIMTLSITIKNATLSITSLNAYAECHYDECLLILNVNIKSNMLSVIMLNVGALLFKP